MESIYPISSLKGNRFPVVGGSYNFHLEIENPTPLLNIRRVILSLGVSKWYKDVIIDTFPASVKDSIPLSPEIDSWYPQFTLIGYNNSGYLQQVDFYFPLPVVSTNIRPIYDARLACSVWNVDQWKINPIRSFLNKWGFDYSTLGLEVQPKAVTGPQLLESENDWAKGGDCLVVVLTRRDTSLTTGQGLPPAWTHTESGLSYDVDRPQLAFIEKGVKLDALFKHLDSDHIIEFDPASYSITDPIEVQMRKFRVECENYRSKRSFHGLVDFAVKGLAVVGGAVILSKLFDK